MSRNFRNLVWFCVGVSLAVWVSFANATIPASSQYCGPSGNPCATDYQDAALASAKSFWPEYASVVTVSGFTQVSGTSVYTFSVYRGAAIGNNYVGSGSVSIVYFCPSNSSGRTVCTCNTGFDEVNGSCQPKCTADQVRHPDGTCGDDCKKLNNQVTTYRASSFDAFPDVVCSKGSCRLSRIGGKDGFTCTLGICSAGVYADYLNLGTSCNRSQDDKDKQDAWKNKGPDDGLCPDGKTFQGTVNNQPVCAYPNKENPKPSTKVETSTKTNADGSKDTTTRTTTCDADGRCSVKEQTTHTNADGTAGGTITKEGQGEGEEGANGVGGGGGGNPQNDFCRQNPKAASCAQLDTPSEGEEIKEKQIGANSITPISVGASAGSCPASIPLPKGMQVSYEGPCTYATAMRPITLAVAWLAALYIVFGLKSGE